jgi:hypothetical protein
MTATIPKLYNGKELANAMGVSPYYVSAMKRAGYRFKYSHQTTLEHAMEWREQNPEFTVSLAYERNQKKAA